MSFEFLSSIPPKIIEDAYRVKLTPASETCQQEIESLLNRTVLVGGKRLRPLLTHLMANFFGLSTDEISPYARAIELVHAASLAHDDVIDNATMRRGLPSINVEGSNKKAVLAGDYLLAQVIVDLSNAGNLELVKEMSLVIQALSEGEWLQLDSSSKREYSKEIIEKIALCKTSSVMIWCAVAPAILKKLSTKTVQYCREFGENLGLAFQFIDDTFDFNVSSKKDPMLDIKNGIVNSVLFDWMENHPKIKYAFKTGSNLENLLEGQSLDESCKKVTKESLDRLDRCKELLELIVKDVAMNEEELQRMEKAKQPLVNILDYLGSRSF